MPKMKHRAKRAADSKTEALMQKPLTPKLDLTMLKLKYEGKSP